MATAIDPVCDMEVDTANPPGGTFEYEGTTYFFCSPACREEFAANPSAYPAQP
jgi:Cu+-exporting ATPase